MAAFIGNTASCLRPLPDRFHPDLLLGFFHEELNGDAGVSLQRIRGSFEPLAFAVPAAGGAGASVDLALYDTPLSSRDGLLLLKGRKVDDLCLYNAMTGDHKFLPAAALEADTYILVTGYDLSPPDDLCVRVIAVKAELADTYDRSVTAFRHQQLSPTSGGGAVWGPVERSPEFTKNLNTILLPGNEVVCGGAIHWLGLWTLDWHNWFGHHLTPDEILVNALALDVRTGRTWATKLPDECRHGYSRSLVLATSGDCRLSAMMDRDIEVWVLVSEDEWMLQRRVAVPALNLDNLLWKNYILFCPRSGCVLVEVEGGDLVIEVDTGYLKTLLHKSFGYGPGGYRYPCEMNWSTYLLSRMKVF